VSLKILRFSISMGFVGALLTVAAYLTPAYPSVLRWRNVNLNALSEIKCAGDACDTSVYSTDPRLEDADYVVDAKSRFFIDEPHPTAASPERYPPMDYSDTAFIGKFRQPASCNTPDGEVWRLYSRTVGADGKGLEVFVGYALKAPNKAIEIPNSLIADVDSALKREADKIASIMSTPGAAVRPPRSVFSADGFQVVDPDTKRVVEQGPWIPAYLPEGVPLPSSGLKLYMQGAELYAAQTETDTDGRLLATSFTEIGSLGWVACSCAVGFLFAAYITHALSRRFLRHYIAVSGMQVPSLEEAMRSGEGQSVEFKRGLSSDENRAGSVETEILKSIVAFANTNDGVIFIGVDDAGHVKRLELDFTQRDRMEQKIRELIRSRIKPTPPVQITFENVRGLLVAKIAVASGEAPAYMIGGTIYIRNGSSDVQAQPEDVVRLVSEFAF